MGICKGCGASFPKGKGFHPNGFRSWKDPDAGAYCSESCYNSHTTEAERKSHASSDKLMYWIFFFPFMLVWAMRKPIVWCCKKIGHACWVVMKNKWTWNIFTCGFSWVAWKMLDAIYNPKD